MFVFLNHLKNALKEKIFFGKEFLHSCLSNHSFLLIPWQTKELFLHFKKE